MNRRLGTLWHKHISWKTSIFHSIYLISPTLMLYSNIDVRHETTSPCSHSICYVIRHIHLWCGVVSDRLILTIVVLNYYSLKYLRKIYKHIRAVECVRRYFGLSLKIISLNIDQYTQGQIQSKEFFYTMNGNLFKSMLLNSVSATSF